MKGKRTYSLNTALDGVASTIIAGYYKGGFINHVPHAPEKHFPMTSVLEIVSIDGKTKTISD